MKRINVWNTYDLGLQKKCDDFAASYMNFLDHGKTERECVDQIVRIAEENGFRELNDLIEKIVVHEKEEIDGETVMKLDIYYRFIGKVGNAKENDLQVKKG